MKKIVLAFAGTVSVIVLLFGYDTSTAGPMATTSQTSVISGGATTAPSGSDSSGSDSSGSDSSGNASSGSDSSGSGSTGASQSSTVTGDVAQTRWGPVQVELTLDGDTISDVSVVQYPNGNGKDQEINSYALPILVQETIDAQSSDIDMVSGATVTSVGYQQSLQSAIDQAST
ncbi:FMN-binding protein [Nocardioides sp. URHA0020]|uniref:FMN-binding protein n=1 Tax=Nocardioides sp. URHA0020 TaxID=1380392 RepID=UPI000491336B|nr:FMN-binding protein [Nocardioides sp. URHA0020]